MARVIDEPRFVVKQNASNGLSFDVSSHRTFTEAEAYVTGLGRTGTHNELYIVDLSKNTLADTADEAEQAHLAAALETERKRTELMDITAANNKRARELAAETAALKANG